MKTSDRVIVLKELTDRIMTNLRNIHSKEYTVALRYGDKPIQGFGSAFFVVHLTLYVDLKKEQDFICSSLDPDLAYMEAYENLYIYLMNGFKIQ